MKLFHFKKNWSLILLWGMFPTLMFFLFINFSKGDVNELLIAIILLTYAGCMLAWGFFSGLVGKSVYLHTIFLRKFIPLEYPFLTLIITLLIANVILLPPMALKEYRLSENINTIQYIHNIFSGMLLFYKLILYPFFLGYIPGKVIFIITYSRKNYRYIYSKLTN